jgi:hypothetical protein
MAGGPQSSRFHWNRNTFLLTALIVGRLAQLQFYSERCAELNMLRWLGLHAHWDGVEKFRFAPDRPISRRHQGHSHPPRRAWRTSSSTRSIDVPCAMR